jgi:hypothetical protein
MGANLPQLISIIKGRAGRPRRPFPCPAMRHKLSLRVAGRSFMVR